jgi:hypothetical protein
MPTTETKLKAAPSEKPIESITVPKTQMDEILAKMAEQDKQIQMLTEISDKSRKFNWDQKNQDFSQKTVRLSFYKGQAVMAWRTVKDEVFQDQRGIWHEDQRIELVLENNERLEVSYMDFVKFIEKKDGTVTSQTVTNGKTSMKIMLGEKEYEVDTRFLN